MEKIAILTPTYNRAHTLERAYISLLQQTEQSFKWIIIDDGSIDDTENLIKRFLCEGKIKIQYIKKENGGKASALNTGLDVVDTPYCMCLDSDDYLTPYALEYSLKVLNAERNNDHCCGVLALRHKPDGEVIGNKTIPAKYKYVTIVQLYNDCKIRSELFNVYKASIVKQYRFPIIEGEKFMPPSWFHYKLSENYVFRTMWDKLCVCEYISDGLTKNKVKVIVKNPIGYTLIKRISFEKSTRTRNLIRNAIMYGCGCILSKNKNYIRESPNKLLSILTYPISYLVYMIRFR